MPPASRICFTFSHALGSKPFTGISVRTWSRLLTSQPAFFRAGSMSSFLVVASLGFGLDNFGAPVVLSQRQLYTRGVLLSKCVLYGFQYHIDGYTKLPRWTGRPECPNVGSPGCGLSRARAT